MDNRKYFIYARVSDTKYESSIETQKKILEDLIIKDGISLDNTIFYSDKKSWKEWSYRENFDIILNELNLDSKNPVTSRKYWWVYFFKVDRLARWDSDFQKIFKLVDDGYLFKSATETIENTPTWRLLFRLLSSFAIHEIEKLSNREIITNIHNIINKNFLKLWWATSIFGYKKENNEILIVEKEKEIIIDIYETFLRIKENNENKESKDSKNIKTYKDIFDYINKKYDNYLINYLLKKENTQNQTMFISSILNNNKMLKYNWYIDRNIGVRDTLIKNTIDMIFEQNDWSFEFSWENKISWSVKFSVYEPSLVIITDILEKRVKSYLENNKKNNNKNTNSKFNGLFESILYFEKNWNLLKVESPYITSKKTYQYRKNLNRKSYEISEKTIENRIYNSWFINEIISIPNEYKALLYKWFQNADWVNNKSSLLKLNWTKNIYNYFINRYQFKLDNDKDCDYTLLIKEKQYYEKLLEDIENKIRLINEKKNPMIEKIFSFFDIKNYYDLDSYSKRDFFLAFVNKITYDENNVIHIFLPAYLTALWMNEKIEIF